MIQHHDILGQQTPLRSTASLEHWNRLILAFLAHGAATPTHLGALLEAEPDFAMGHAIKGLFCVMLGRREMFETAREALQAAKTARSTRAANAREEAFVNALDVWLNGSPRGAIAAMERILRANPEDTLALKISHAIRFILGDSAGMRRSVEAVLPTYAPDHAARGYVFGCHAFALEETGEYAKAETAGRMGLGLAPDDAWGLHAVAHVFDMTGNSKGGLNWLNGRESAWAHCNNFRYHVWWHKALMHLDQGEIDVVLELYDTEVRADKTDDYRDISNGTSMLMRLELEGVDVGDRWEELAELSASRAEDGCLIFADLHYLLALVGGNHDAAITKLMGRMRRKASHGRCEVASIAAHPGLAAATGLEAFGEADFETAYINLARARLAMPTIGGSHAQRDVFERITIDAAIRAGYLDEAAIILADRTALRGGHEDRYTAVRHDLIERGRTASSQHELKIPAQ
jgi:tetratricopeptide (TPR) repeat protein